MGAWGTGAAPKPPVKGCVGGEFGVGVGVLVVESESRGGMRTRHPLLVPKIISLSILVIYLKYHQASAHTLAQAYARPLLTGQTSSPNPKSCSDGSGGTTGSPATTLRRQGYAVDAAQRGGCSMRAQDVRCCSPGECSMPRKGENVRSQP